MWPKFTIFGRNVAEKICNLFMLCCSPHLFSVVTLPQESKVAIQLCMYMSISSINSSHNVNDKNVQAEQNHSNSQCLRKCHNLCWKCLPSADTQQRRLKQRLVEAWSAMPQRVIHEAIDEWCRRLCCCWMTHWSRQVLALNEEHRVVVLL